MRVIRKRRRLENKTDYLARKVLLSSNLPRVVFRKTNKYISGQLVSSKEAQDSVLIGVSSKELESFGWQKEASGSLKSVTAAYLTGFLLGKKVIEKLGKTKAVFDLGLYRSIAGSREYGFLKGVVDSGVEVGHDSKVFPEDSRIEGRHLKVQIDFKKIKEKIEKE